MVLEDNHLYTDYYYYYYWNCLANRHKQDVADYYTKDMVVVALLKNQDAFLVENLEEEAFLY